jgi:hypothetical protein
VDTVVTAVAGAPGGWDTYTLAVTLKGAASNVYTIYGTASSPLSVPGAYQCATPFGSNTGGTNAAFWAVANNAALGYAQYDSWVTVGITDGDSAGALSSIGLDFAAWTATAGLSTTDGAVFWMSPDGGPVAGTDAVIAQLTVASGSSDSATMGMQGRSTGGAADWTSDNINFSVSTHAIRQLLVISRGLPLTDCL